MSAESIPSRQTTEQLQAEQYAESLLRYSNRTLAKLQTLRNVGRPTLQTIPVMWKIIPHTENGFFIEDIDEITIDETGYRQVALGMSTELQALNDVRPRIGEAASKRENLYRNQSGIAAKLGALTSAGGVIGGLTETFDSTTVGVAGIGAVSLFGYAFAKSKDPLDDMKKVCAAVQATIDGAVEQADVTLSDYAPWQDMDEDMAEIKIVVNGTLDYLDQPYFPDKVGRTFSPILAFEHMYNEDAEPRDLWESLLRDELTQWTHLQNEVIAAMDAVDVAIERLQFTGVEVHEREIKGLKITLDDAEQRLKDAFKTTLEKYSERVSEQRTILLANKLLQEHDELLNSVIEVSESQLDHPCRETLRIFRDVLFDVALQIDTQDNTRMDAFRCMTDYVTAMQSMLTDGNQAQQFYAGLCSRFGAAIELPEWTTLEERFADASISQ